MIRKAHNRNQHKSLRICILLMATAVCDTWRATTAAAAQPLRSEAALSVTFDESTGDAKVAVTGVSEALAAKLIGSPKRVPSPFWSQAGKNALLLDASKRQCVQLAEIPYLDRPDAVTLSVFFLSLHAPADQNPHGILGKRSDSPRGTNYGINYVPASDIFQVYVNDGRGFHIANYSARRIIGTRRLVHLTATLEVGDAPSPKADNKRDDLRVRLFLNGEAARPKSVSGGIVQDSDVWLTKLNVAGLLNDAPLTLGSSTPQTEFTSGLVDEFLLFTRALSPSEAHRLFLEIAGPDGPKLAKRELQSRPVTAPPVIESISQLGLQIGQTTRLSIQGNGLAGEPRVDLPIAGIKQTVVHGSDKRHFMVDLTLPSDVPPGIYPLSVVTKQGLSKPVGIAVDGLPQWLVGDSTPDHPSSLPAAFSGLLSGAGQSRVYFNGKAGARVVAEVEAKRIGSGMDPVLELKNLSGMTVAIEWGKTYLRGDARIEATLPINGTYFVELHDLEYRAPGDSPFRLLVGDFSAVDQYFPAVAERGSELSVKPIGTGLATGTVISADLKDSHAGLAKFLTVPRELHASGPLPPLRISDGIEIVQVAQPGHQLQTIDARFADKRSAPVAVNGRLTKTGQIDRYLLAVTPGRPLALSVDGRSLNSPVDGEISVRSYPGAKVLATDGGTPGATAKGMQYQVPADVASIEVDVRDLLGRGGPHFVYRLRIAPAGRPSFSLTCLDSRINVPRDGRAVVELRVDRSGYAGPIDLKIEGNDNIAIAPSQLPAEGGSRKVLVTFNTTAKPLNGVERLRIVGQSVGITPPVRRVAVIESPNQAQLAGFLDLIPVAPTAESPAKIEMDKLPSFVLKGVDAEWPVSAAPIAKQAGDWLRLSLISTETARPNQPGKRRKVKRLIAALPDQGLSTAMGKGSLKVSVPLDIAEPAIDLVVKADVVSNPYSNRVLATSYSKPFRVLVQDAVGLKVDPASLNLVAGSGGKVRGKLFRHPAFRQKVNVAISGLPAGYGAAPVMVAGDKTDFEIPVTAPKEATARAIPNVSITVTLADGKVPITQPLDLKVAPPATPAALKKK
ncbi:MAG TPA: hypothetical protein VHX68_13430 [Planctomycetaceae bacterium]|nr:hypothetical protein [Planctomycetaceae bacterium]